MAESSIPVDLFNPGQVFACIGFAEIADVLLGEARGVFDWSDPLDVRFSLAAGGDDSPVRQVLRFLDRAEVQAVAPDGSKNLDSWTKSWGAKPRALPRVKGYPFPDPSSPATLVCVLSNSQHSIAIEHWGDATKRDNVKFWAGAGGYPGAGLARDALELIRGEAEQAFERPFDLSAPQSSSFRLDWRRDYVPLHAGFSPNAHGDVVTLGYPVVELLAAVGLTHARPRRPERRNKLLYRYAVAGRERDGDTFYLPLNLLRASLGGVNFQFPMKHFRMLLDWPGQEGQARAITIVNEEKSE